MKYLPQSLLTLLMATCSVAIAGVGDLGETEFLREYGQAVKRIREVYENVRVSCKQTDTFGKEENWDYFRNEESTCWTKIESETGASTVLVSDPNASFKLSRNSASASYSVSRIADATAKGTRAFVASVEARTLPIFAPFRAYLEEPIDQFLRKKNCKIKAVSSAGEAPNRTVRVEWEIAPTKPSGKTRFGHFEFLPDSSWVIKNYSIYFRNGYQDKQTGKVYDQGRGADLEYQGEHDGVPFIRQVKTWTSAVNRAAGPTFEVTKFVAGPVPKEEFTLAAFGIDTSPIASRTPIMYPLLGLSAACGLGVVIFRYLANRSIRTPQQGAA